MDVTREQAQVMARLWWTGYNPKVIRRTAHSALIVAVRTRLRAGVLVLRIHANGDYGAPIYDGHGNGKRWQHQ